MLLSLWLMSQFVLITLLVAGGAVAPQTPLQLALLGAVGLLAVAPAVLAVIAARRLPSAHLGWTERHAFRAACPATFRMPTAPGNPGMPRSRAPSH